MYQFNSDYLEGADERVLRALVDTNGEQSTGYGEDAHCTHARELLRALMDCPSAAVHFVVGGTQANLTVIATALRPWEGVLSADTGHINVHESGAIEATGHKVLPLPNQEGKITAAQVEAAVRAHREDVTHEHMVKPAMVYISHPTEFGALYTRLELNALAQVCRDNGLLLFLDGARLAYALATDSDVDLPYLAEVCDAFTLGGTKAGLLFGEAIVLPNPRLHDCFRYSIKQRGGMLAKGRLLGVQFKVFLSDCHYLTICRRANALAARISKAFTGKGFPLLSPTAANQVFPILPDDVVETLKQRYVFAHWERVDSAHCAVRFCASATTTEEAVRALEADVAAL